MFVNWRVYSGFIFLLQSLRIPLAILLVSDIKFLDDYFLIISTSIPAQFFAAEVLTYRGISFKKMSKNEIITIFTIIMTIFYFLILHSITLTIIYVLYIFSILVLFYTTYFIRKIGGG